MIKRQTMAGISQACSGVTTPEAGAEPQGYSIMWFGGAADRQAIATAPRIPTIPTIPTTSLSSSTILPTIHIRTAFRAC